MRDNLAVLPCSTQFTVSEFEEYFFHKEKIRLVVRTLRRPEKEHNRILFRSNQVVRTSHFEHLLRKRNGGNSDGSMLLHELIRDVKRSSDISELVIVLGNGAVVEYYNHTYADGEDIGHSSGLGNISLSNNALRALTLSQARDTYQRNVSAAREFETVYEFENFYRTAGSNTDNKPH